jgi:hypothetical protein
VIVARHLDDEGQILAEIKGAEPREQMDAELMQQIALGLSPWARLDGDVLQVLGCTAFPSLPGHVLTVWDDYGHRYIYKITGYDWSADVFDLEWPD